MVIQNSKVCNSNQNYKPTNGSTTTIEADGDYRNAKFIIGEPFELHYRFSKQRITEAATE